MIRRRERDPVAPDYPELLGDRTGLVKSITTFHFGRDFPDASLAIPVHCHVAELIDGLDGPVKFAVGGKGDSLRESFHASLGETVERLCHLYPDPDRLRRASHRELRRAETVVDWKYVDVYNEAVIGDWVSEITRDTEVYWTSGTNLLTGESVYVPADRVWDDASPSMDDWTEPPTYVWTSNGSAAGPSLESAVVGGIYEILERDAFVRVWSRQESPPRLDLTDAPELHQFASEEFDYGQYWIDLIGYDSPVDVPVVGACLRNRREEMPNFIIAGAAHLDPETAVRDALREMAQIFTFFTKTAGNVDPDRLDIEDREKGFAKPTIHYSLPDNFDDVSFLLEGEPRSISSYSRPDVSGDRAELAFLLETLERADCTPIAVDVTTRPVYETGARVVKVIVPELLDFAPQYAVQANHPVFDGEDVTLKPHPYP